MGAAAEWYQGARTVRAGVFDGSNVPNSVHLEPGIHEGQGDLELEKPHEILGHPSKVMQTAYETRARLGLLDEAVQIAQATGNPVDIAATRRLRNRFGADINLEQELLRISACLHARERRPAMSKPTTSPISTGPSQQGCH